MTLLICFLQWPEFAALKKYVKLVDGIDQGSPIRTEVEKKMEKHKF